MGAGGLTKLSVWWMRLGIHVERITPGKAQENGRQERLHRTLKAETARPAKYDPRSPRRYPRPLVRFAREFSASAVGPSGVRHSSAGRSPGARGRHLARRLATMGTEAARATRGRNPVFRTSSAVPAWGAILVSSGIFLSTRSFTWNEAAWVALLAAFLAAIPRRVEVGAEGVRIAWLGVGRLVRYEDVRRAEPLGGDDVALTFTNGETLRLVRGGSDGACPRHVLERLWQTLARGAEDGPRPNERAALARGSRSVEDWLADLRRLATQGGQYRQGLVTLDRLFSIATNPGIEVEVRGAAAVASALGGGLDEARRDELRAIALQTLDRALRAVLLGTAEAGDEGDLCAALREIA